MTMTEKSRDSILTNLDKSEHRKGRLDLGSMINMFSRTEMLYVNSATSNALRNAGSGLLVDSLLRKQHCHHFLNLHLHC